MLAQLSAPIQYCPPKFDDLNALSPPPGRVASFWINGLQAIEASFLGFAIVPMCLIGVVFIPAGRC
jgi:hypothetical protein